MVVGVVLIFDASLTARLRHIPGPPPWPVVGHVPYMLKEPWRVFADYSRKYGSVYLFRLFTKPMVVISDPDLVRQCFRDREALYLKDQWSYDYFRCVVCVCHTRCMSRPRPRLTLTPPPFPPQRHPGVWAGDVRGQGVARAPHADDAGV